MIKLIVNDVELDLKSDTVVALTKKAAEIGNLQNRWSSYTNKFNVPATKKNRDALGLKQFQDASGSQYEYQNGKLISGGLEIASNVLVIIESVSQDITLTLRAGNGSLFDAMNKTKLSDLYWDDLNHTWNALNIWLNHNSDYNDGFTYPIFQSGGQSNVKKVVYYNAMLPFIFVKSTFERIANYFGYTWSGDTYTLDMFERLTYPIANLKITPDFLVDYVYHVTFQTTILSPSFESSGRAIDILAIIDDPKNLNILTQVRYSFFGGSGWQSAFETVYVYSARFKGKYKFELNYNIDYLFASSSSYMRVGVYSYNKKTNTVKTINAESFPVNLTLTNIIATVNYEYNLEEIDEDINNLVFYARYELSGVKFRINSGYFRVTEVVAEETFFNRDLQIAVHQPDLTIGKFVKEIGNVFGAIYDVDEFKKTIDITRLDEIATNKSIAYDWSDKLDINQPIIVTYILDGIGKITKWQWKEDLEYSKLLNVNNDQLPEISIYIKSDAEYSNSYSVMNIPIPVINMQIWDSDLLYAVPDGKFKLALIKSHSSPGISFPTYTTSTNYNLAYFDYTNSPYSLDWSYLYDTYFADLLGPMTDRLQVVECYMKLNDLDIQSFKFKIPVYVKRFNRYFFVNEISEYTGKTQSTKVVLVGI